MSEYEPDQKPEEARMNEYELVQAAEALLDDGGDCEHLQRAFDLLIIVCHRCHIEALKAQVLDARDVANRENREKVAVLMAAGIEQERARQLEIELTIVRNARQRAEEREQKLATRVRQLEDKLSLAIAAGG